MEFNKFYEIMTNNLEESLRNKMVCTAYIKVLYISLKEEELTERSVGLYAMVFKAGFNAHSLVKNARDISNVM